MPYDEFSAERIKHLEMVQAVVARLGTDSFLIKGWAVTLTVALFGFAISGDDWRLAVLGAGPALALWCLDAYFLRAERLFRHLYDAIRSGSPEVEPFFMAATGAWFESVVSRQYPDSQLRWRGVALSPTLRWFYLSLVVLAAALAVVLHCR